MDVIEQVENVAANLSQEQAVTVGVCETCAERGRPNEPVYKIGMCRFCYHGLPHPKATSEELARERIGAWSTQRRLTRLSRQGMAEE